MVDIYRWIWYIWLWIIARLWSWSFRFCFGSLLFTIRIVWLCIYKQHKAFINNDLKMRFSYFNVKLKRKRRDKMLPLGNGFSSTAGALSLRWWWSVLLKPWIFQTNCHFKKTVKQQQQQNEAKKKVQWMTKMVFPLV